MRRLLIICFLFFYSCEDFSVLEKDKKNVFFFKNSKSINEVYSGQLSIATFNIKFGFCKTCDPFSGSLGGSINQLDLIAELINFLDLDIVSLQEVGLDYDVTIVQNQAEYIARKTNMNFAYGINRGIQSENNLFLNGLWGNAILSKYEITNNPEIEKRKHNYACLFLMSDQTHTTE